MSIITEQSPLTFNDALPDAVDVVVIGAGIAGTASSYFLAQHGLKVVLCEKGRVAGEQSSRSFGWVRVAKAERRSKAVASHRTPNNLRAMEVGLRCVTFSCGLRLR